MRWARRATLATVAIFALLVLAAWSSRSGNGLVAAAVRTMPAGGAKVVQRSLDTIGGAVFGQGNDGFRWIIVSDPRTRKADRLPVEPPRR